MKAIFNGELVDENFTIPIKNRGFLFSDSVVEFFTVKENQILNLEDHYFNLCASMRIFRLPIPIRFTQELIQQKIRLLLSHLNKYNAVFRIQIFREQIKNISINHQKVSYWIQEETNEFAEKNLYRLDVYKDYTLNSNLYNRIKKPEYLEGFGKIYAEENELDDLLLLNQNKHAVQTLKGVLFMVQNHQIFTPMEEDGAKISAERTWMIKQIKTSNQFTVQEESLHPFKLTQADAVFILTFNYQIHFVTHFKKKTYSDKMNHDILKLLKF